MEGSDTPSQRLGGGGSPDPPTTTHLKTEGLSIYPWGRGGGRLVAMSAAAAAATVMVIAGPHVLERIPHRVQERPGGLFGGWPSPPPPPPTANI